MVRVVEVPGPELTHNVEGRARIGVFDDLDPDREGVLDNIEMCDHEDLLEFVADRLNGFDQMRETLLVLRASTGRTASRSLRSVMDRVATVSAKAK